MNAADQAIEEIRAVRHRISREHNHDVAKHLASLRAEQEQYAVQLQQGAKLLAQRKIERTNYPNPANEAVPLRERPKT